MKMIIYLLGSFCLLSAMDLTVWAENEIEQEKPVPESLDDYLKTTEVLRLLKATGDVVKQRQGANHAWKNGRLNIEALTELEKERLTDVIGEMQPKTFWEAIYLTSGWEAIYTAFTTQGIPPQGRFRQILPQSWQSRGFNDYWLMTLPARYESPHRVIHITKNVVWLKTYGNLGGLYQIEEDRWKMLIPTDDRMMKHEWKVLNSNVIVMINSSTAAGADYTGATLTRMIDIKEWPRR